MSTKSHFIYEDGVEGYEETSEPQSTFGKFRGFNAYLFIDPDHLRSVKIKGDYLYVEVRNTNELPLSFKVWGDAIIEADVDEDGLMIILKGGHHVTNEIIKKQFEPID